MELLMIGLGKMGANMTKRLLQGGHRVVVSDLSPAAVQRAVDGGAIAAESLADLPNLLSAPRAVWVMVPVDAVDDMIAQLVPLLQADDIIIDGGNCRHSDSTRRAADLAQNGIHFLDAGVSGGIWGLEIG